MSLIRSTHTKPEAAVFRALRKQGIYFQKHYKKAIGNPDIALPSKKKAVFIDGDFWHGFQFNVLKRRLPKRYWLKKITNNVKRDKKYRAILRKQGWSILRVWEHKVLNDFDRTFKRIVEFLKP